MAESHVVSGLVAKKSELAGLVQHYQAEINRISFDLKHLNATIKLFAPEMDLRTLRPKEYRERTQYFKPGEAMRITLDVMRVANKPILHSEIVEQVTLRKDFAGNPAAIEQTGKTIYKALSYLLTKGSVKQIRDAGRAIEWVLV